MDFVFIIIILIMSVVVHETAHGYAALALGDPTAKHQGRLTLNPLNHLDPMGSIILPGLMVLFNTGFIIGWAKPVPFNPYNLRNQRWGEAIVAAAGPLSNIALAIIFGLFIQFSLLYGLLSQASLALVSQVVFINLLLAIFNLIPIPPLDGSKILFAFLPYRFQNFRANLERFGLVLVLLFVFVFWRLISPIIFYFFSLLTGVAF